MNLFFFTNSYSENNDIYKILEELRKDIQTLEKAVYSGSIQANNDNNNVSDFNLSNNEDVQLDIY